MLLQKIKIKGFKSFPDTAELELERGITGIVGPNGCGKSNIADSINWALGEQSPTSLRGKRMEQMIFNGSSSRKALGAAEVTLVLKTNGNLSAAIRSSDEEKELERQGSALARLLESSNGEVTITRRMFRDAQSDYLLNGKPCRLRDIQDLLMGLGIGSRAITIIEQDKINAILNARPVDRRELIEDAAGITKFKLNRHLTRLKLERTADRGPSGRAGRSPAPPPPPGVKSPPLPTLSGGDQGDRNRPSTRTPLGTGSAAERKQQQGQRSRSESRRSERRSR